MSTELKEMKRNRFFKRSKCTDLRNRRHGQKEEQLQKLRAERVLGAEHEARARPSADSSHSSLCLVLRPGPFSSPALAEASALVCLISLICPYRQPCKMSFVRLCLSIKRQDQEPGRRVEREWGGCKAGPGRRAPFSHCRNVAFYEVIWGTMKGLDGGQARSDVCLKWDKRGHVENTL